MNRWAIYIDIEGASNIYPVDEMRFFQAFDALLSALCSIGTKVYPETPNRLFAHQLGGDGLLVVSEFAEGNPEVPISIAVVLLQVLLMHDAVGKGGISAGRFGYVQGCFPSLRNMTKSCGNVYQLGRGLLTVIPVMGTALINAHRLASQAPSGSLLAVDPTLLDTLPAGIVLRKEGTNSVVIDWVHTRTYLMEDILTKSGINLPLPSELERRLFNYVIATSDHCGEKWRDNTLLYNGYHKETGKT